MTLSSLRSWRRPAVMVLMGSCLMLSGLPLCRAELPTGLPEDQQALLVLNRLGYGPRPGDVQRVQRMGVERYLDQQLHPERIPLPAALHEQLQSLPTEDLGPAELFRTFGPPSFGDASTPEADRQAARRKAGEVLTPDVHRERLWRATESPRQLQEVMTEFWFNHFNVYEGKDWSRYWEGDYEERALRPYALGHFRDLLGAVAHHPAMLYYLDNWESSAGMGPDGKPHGKGLNENYGRELMELHTLGVDGGYTQQDVTTLARILTGWTIDVPGMKSGTNAAFRFDAHRHDDSPQVFLGQPMHAQGEAEGEEALDRLASAPATAHFLAFELAQYFVADRPDPAMVNAMAQRFRSTDGDIAAVIDTMVHQPQFWAHPDAKFKTPYQFVISALRATGTPVVNVHPVERMLDQMGQPLYGWITPDGYANTQETWLNPDAMLQRINVATEVANDASNVDQPDPRSPLPGSPTERHRPVPIDAQALLDVLGPMISASTRATVQASPSNLRAALILGSPDFMKR